MRRCLLFSTATLLCCGFPSFASAQFSLTAATPTPAPQLYLAQNDSPSEPARVTDEAQSPADTAKESPFDLFSTDSGDAKSSSESSLGQGDSAQGTSEPNSTPVGRHHRSASPAETIIAGSYAANQNNYYPPIDWNSQTMRAPNHTADYMQLQWCADGLWDNYPAERAAQCARQAERIAGRHHCGHCGMAGPCGQAGYYQPAGCQSGLCRHGGVCGSCGNFGHAGHFRQARHFGQGCNCGNCGPAGRVQCDEGAPATHSNIHGHHQPSCGCAQAGANHTAAPQVAPTQYVQAPVGPNGRPISIFTQPTTNMPPAQDVVPQMPPAQGKVAWQPTNINR